MKQRTKNLILFFILFVITGVVFWNYVSMHYATDTYNIMNIGYEKYAINNSLSDGRILVSYYFEEPYVEPTEGETQSEENYVYEEQE